jgi:hypothetical protein
MAMNMPINVTILNSLKDTSHVYVWLVCHVVWISQYNAIQLVLYYAFAKLSQRHVL